MRRSGQRNECTFIKRGPEISESATYGTRGPRFGPSQVATLGCSAVSVGFFFFGKSALYQLDSHGPSG